MPESRREKPIRVFRAGFSAQLWFGKKGVGEPLGRTGVIEHSHSYLDLATLAGMVPVPR